jgi:DNA-binding MarR family transcriptional regulator
VEGWDDERIAATPGTTAEGVASHPPGTRAPDRGARPRTAEQIRRADNVRAVDPEWLDERQQRTWRAWLAVTELLPRTLDAQLQRDAGLTHAAYIVLAMLSEAPDRSRRMSDLARTANQSQSRLSHTVARLEERGWVRRERAIEDRRGNLAVLTDAGWDVVQRVAPGHVVAVRESLFAALTPAQTEVLEDALTAVLERLDPDHTLRVPELG